ncbi:restriction endonuclease subunit S [Lacisediminihabitans sp. FW035]
MKFSTVALRRVAKIVNGGTPTPDERNWNGGVPWATPVDLGARNGQTISETSRTLTTEGVQTGSAIAPLNAVLLSTRAPIGYVARVKVSMAFNQGCKAIVPGANLNSSFLLYSIVHATDKLQSLGQGSTFQELSGSSLAAIEFPLPGLSEQRQIAHYLDTHTAKIDTLIGKQEQLIETLAERRQAVISHAVTKGLDPLAELKSSGMKWMGHTPSHWRKLKLRWSFDFLNGDRGINYPSSDEMTDEGVPFINAGHLRKGDLDWAAMNYITPEKYAQMGGAKLRSGDILYCLRGSLGKNALVQRLDAGALASSLVAIRSKRLECMHTRYLYLLLNSVAETQQREVISAGSAQPNLSAESVAAFSFFVPPLEEQQSITAFVDREINQMDGLSAKAGQMIDVLKERRQALISAAVTGKIDVRGMA